MGSNEVSCDKITLELISPQLHNISEKDQGNVSCNYFKQILFCATYSLSLLLILFF